MTGTFNSGPTDPCSALRWAMRSARRSSSDRRGSTRRDSAKRSSVTPARWSAVADSDGRVANSPTTRRWRPSRLSRSLPTVALTAQTCSNGSGSGRMTPTTSESKPAQYFDRASRGTSPPPNTSNATHAAALATAHSCVRPRPPSTSPGHRSTRQLPRHARRRSSPTATRPPDGAPRCSTS